MTYMKLIPTIPSPTTTTFLRFPTAMVFGDAPIAVKSGRQDLGGGRNSSATTALGTQSEMAEMAIMATGTAATTIRERAEREE